MKLSNLLFKKQSTNGSLDKTTDQLIRGGYILQESAGIFQFAPLGLKVLRNLEDLIRQHLDDAGCSEVKLPILQSMDLWKKSGRSTVYGSDMFRLKDRHDKEMCLAPTSEESCVFMVNNFIESYTQLPMIVYQIENKARNEQRPRFGLMRNSLFVMKDAYSFDRDAISSQQSYFKMYKLYNDIFDDLELNFLAVPADTGEIGGEFSQNFFVLSEYGEDEISLKISWDEFKTKQEEAKTYADLTKLSSYIGGPHTYKVAEIGHIFSLGTKYSTAMDANFMDNDGKQKPFFMGCYGIGVSRCIQIIAEQCKFWPYSMTPYFFCLVGVDSEKADKFYEESEMKEYILYYDRKDGMKTTMDICEELFKIPIFIIIGDRYEVQLKKSNNKIVTFKTAEQLDEYLANILDGDA